MVAIATGMFTLRDQIFPGEADTAVASTSVYETSVGGICTALNQANGVLGSNADNLRRRLTSAKTALAKRNAVLDSWNVVLDSSQYELGQFEGLDVPSALEARERATAAAWNRIVGRLRSFTRQLDAVSDDAGVMAVVLTLPTLGAANASDVVTRNAGLTELGGGRCVLNPPVNVPTITLPPLPGTPTVKVSVAPTKPVPADGRRSPTSARGSPPHPKIASVTPSASPLVASPVPRPVTPSVAPRYGSPAPPPRTGTPVIHPPVASLSPGVEAGGGSAGSGGGSSGGGG